MSTFTFLIVVGLFIWNINLSKAIGKIKKQLKQNSAEEPIAIAKTEQFEEKEPEEISITSKKESKPFQWEDFLGRKFFSILGTVSIVLAIGFFVTWAFSNGLIGPKGRIAIGILFSLVLLVSGELMKTKYPKFFPLVSSAGIAGLLIVTFIARYLYEFLSPEQSFVAYILEISAGILLAVRYDSRVLGNFSVAGGILAPILVQSPAPDAIGVLSYLSVLSVAGFTLSTMKRWPEILWMLFIGIMGFEIGIFHEELLKDSPFIALGFLYGLHYLLGSGGIIRCLREKIEQPDFLNLDKKSASELLLFTVSIFSANALGSAIFAEQGWENFGFFVLAQGFLLFGLSEFLKARKLLIFQRICVGATLLSILFATLWETNDTNNFVLTMLLIGEGALFCFAGKSIQEKVFARFGQLALVIASGWIFGLSNFSENTVSALFLVSALIYSVEAQKSLWQKIWNGIALSIASIHILVWNFNQLGDVVPQAFEAALFIVPVLWSAGLIYANPKRFTLGQIIFGGVTLALTNFILWSGFFWKFSTEASLWYVPVISLLLAFIGNFVFLGRCIELEKLRKISAETRRFCTISTLSLATISLLFYGQKFLSEPLLTIVWIVFGGALLGIGFQKSWSHFRYFGLGIFCALIAKLYLIDVWGWETSVRFFAFLVLGIALLVTSFFYQKITSKK